MVRISQSDVTVGLASISAQSIREKIEIGNAVTSGIDVVTDLVSRLAVEERKDELISLSTSMENSLAELQMRIATDPQFNTVASADAEFTRSAEEIFEGLPQSTSTTVRREIEKRFLSSSLNARVSVKNSAYKRQKDNGLAGLDAKDESLKQSFALATDNARRAEIQAEQANLVMLSEWPTEVSKGDRIRDFRLKTDTGYVRGLIDTDQFDLAEDILLDPEQLQGMDELKRQAMLRTLNTARDRADDDVKAARAEFEDETTRVAILQMSAFNAGEGPEYTRDDLERDAPNMSVPDLRSTERAMLQQGVTIVTDEAEFQRLTIEIEDGNADASDHIHAAFDADSFNVDVYRGLLSKNRQLNDDPIQFSPYKQGAKDIRRALGPNSIMDFKQAAPAVLRMGNGIDEFDHFRETHPDATPTDIREEARRIVTAYQPIETMLTNTIKAPYSIDRKTQISLKELLQAEVKLENDFDAGGILDDFQYEMESRIIKIFREEREKLGPIGGNEVKNQ